MKINDVNDVQWNKNVGVGTPTFGFLAGIGYRKLISKENLSDSHKDLIKTLTSKDSNTEEKIETALRLWEMIDYTEELRGIK